ncbi:MAG: hypothetical protein Kow0092_32680 [Deferrisomatales bacterium]
MRVWMALVTALWMAATPAWGQQCDPDEYPEVSQAEIVGNRDAYQGKKVQVSGTFLFSGSDFCYQIRKTKIHTKDYFCFALGTPSLVRLYLKKDHPQADVLMNLRRGAHVTACGVFDYLGADYNYLLVDRIHVEPQP